MLFLFISLLVVFSCNTDSLSAYKATFKISLIVPKEYHAISNMPVTQTTPGELTKRVEFKPSVLMSTYLGISLPQKNKNKNT